MRECAPEIEEPTRIFFYMVLRLVSSTKIRLVSSIKISYIFMSECALEIEVEYQNENNDLSLSLPPPPDPPSLSLSLLSLSLSLIAWRQGEVEAWGALGR